MVLDLKTYKLSKIVTKDLPVALATIEAAIKSLAPYKRYKAIANCLRVLEAEREVVKGHLSHYAKIKDEKGKKT